jgi:hypothetical protein
MNRFKSPPQRYALLSAADLPAYFDTLWREVDERKTKAAAMSPASRVRLGCNGKLLDVDSIGLVVVHEGPQGRGDLIEFVCPSCDALHESPRLP